MSFVSETKTDPFVGNIVDGRYLVRDRVAVGGMATVYLATDKRLGRDVALKIMNPTYVSDADGPDFVSRFRREARAAARLTHPGMVRVYDQGSDGDVNYLTMEYIPGTTLRRRLLDEATLPVRDAFSLIERILEALGAAHRQGLVHRDIKPENVLIDEEGEPKLADFGLARAVTEATTSTTGTVLGTVAYLGPELIQRNVADTRTDVYAAGILLYEMVTGRQPFTGSSAIEIATRHVQEDVPAPSSYVPWLPPEFDHLIARLTARDPNARPNDATEALALIRQTRNMIDDPSMDRRAEPPSGTLQVRTTTEAMRVGDTQVLDPTPTGSTVALPIGLGNDIDDDDDDGPGTDLATMEHEHHRPKPVLWIIAALAAVAMLTGLGVWWYTTFGPGAYTTVPEVAGMTVAEARESLEGAGLDVTVIQAYDDVVAAGEIVGTEPAGGESIAKDGTVTLQVSKGPRMVEVPVIVGILESDSLKRLNDAGFPMPTVEREYHDSIPVDEVISSSTRAGDVVRHDTVITLIVSNGPEPITIPDVVGSSEATAKTTLGAHALDITVVTERTLEADKGFVFRQDPAGDTAGFRTQEITIWVSAGPPLVEVPNFTGLSESQAEARAENEGLEVIIEDRFFTFCSAICGQSEAPGDEVEIGSTITLWY